MSRYETTKRKNMRCLPVFALLLLLAGSAIQSIDAQIKLGKKSWLSAYSRSIQYADTYGSDAAVEDSLTSRKKYSGHTLVDLVTNIQPNENTYINATLRVRNDHGGFWGSGATFDLRTLYIRGIIANVIQYQVGDIDYKLTPYTLQNNQEELSGMEPTIFSVQRDMVYHDRFYDVNNTWRQQGAAFNFGLSFNKGIKEIENDFFIFRQNAAGISGGLERLYGGFRTVLVQSQYLDFHLNYVNAFDIRETGASEDYFQNPVLTGGVNLNFSREKWNFSLHSELGRSKLVMENSADSLALRDYFYDVKFKVMHKKSRLNFTLGLKEVGPGFRSIGAQTKRLLFDRSPLAFQRYGNEQNFRSSGLIDQMRDASLYNNRLSTSLMTFDPAYGNYQPYGEATPNRRGFYGRLNWEDKKERFDFETELAMAEEVVGQGAPELKSFMHLRTTFGFNIDQLIPGLNKKTALTLSFWNENTTRDADSEFVTLDLGNQALSADLECNFYGKFDFLAGVQMHSSSGNEFLRRTDLFGQVVSFDVYETDFSQLMAGAGIRYRFNAKNSLDLQFNRYSFQDNLVPESDYHLNNLTLLFSMKL